MFYNRFTNRREMMKSTMALFAAGLLGKGVPMAEAQSSVQNVNKHSSPSTLKITDMRYTVVKKPGPSPCPLIRIDTNQGVYGLGEVRDVANYQYAMVLKSRIMGENPLNVDYLFEKIAQFGGSSAPGRRRLRGRDGVVGHRRQGLQHARLPDARRQVARQDSHLRRHTRGRHAAGVRRQGQRPQGDGTDLDQGGHRHRCAEGAARHDGRARRPAQQWSTTNACRICSPATS